MPHYYEGFQAVEAMQAASAAVGWNCEFRQMDAGKLEASIALQPVRHSYILCESANRRLDISAKTPEFAVTCLVALAGTRALINGRHLTDDRMMLLAPDIDFHANSNCGAEVWQLYIPSSALDGVVDSNQLGTQVLAGVPDLLTGFRELIRQSLQTSSETVLPHYESRAVDFARSLAERSQRSDDRDRYHRRHKRRALRHAVEHIDDNLTVPISVSAVCSYAGVSQSTLERLFRSEFQQTPLAYIRARRLHAVRNVLKRGLAEGSTIAAVALQHGFTHMGRFSASYRRQFGVLPSADLERLN